MGDFLSLFFRWKKTAGLFICRTVGAQKRLGGGGLYSKKYIASYCTFPLILFENDRNSSTYSSGPPGSCRGPAPKIRARVIYK